MHIWVKVHWAFSPGSIVSIRAVDLSSEIHRVWHGVTHRPIMSPRHNQGGGYVSMSVALQAVVISGVWIVHTSFFPVLARMLYGIGLCMYCS